MPSLPKNTYEISQEDLKVPETKAFIDSVLACESWYISVTHLLSKEGVWEEGFTLEECIEEGIGKKVYPLAGVKAANRLGFRVRASKETVKDMVTGVEEPKNYFVCLRNDLEETADRVDFYLNRGVG